jgi:hypothetical protein
LTTQSRRPFVVDIAKGKDDVGIESLDYLILKDAELLHSLLGAVEIKQHFTLNAKLIHRLLIINVLFGIFHQIKCSLVISFRVCDISKPQISIKICGLLIDNQFIYIAGLLGQVLRLKPIGQVELSSDLDSQ